MALLILFAFLAGIVTILSPCILPILPIVLSGSVGGGKQRPFGVITGFILSFTFFTLFLATIVSATGLSADVLRTLSVVIVITFGVSLLIPQFQIITERLFSQLSNLFPVKQRGNGYWSGFAIGLSLGLVWTPCVGPILASVISLALTGSVNGSAVIITLAYATGTAIPLLAITYGGRTLLQKVPWLLQNSGHIQKVFGVLMILTAVGILFNIDRKFQTYILQAFPQYGVGLTKFEENDFISNALQQLNSAVDQNGEKPATTIDMIENGVMAPELIPGGEWFNSPPLTLQKLRGKVVLIDFWTYTCINCIRTLPYLREWHAKYAQKGLVIIGVHTPEFEFEKKSANVKTAIRDFGLRYPVMQDNNYATWRAYNNHYWPAKYFIDSEGRLRDMHFGEGGYEESEHFIQELLAEIGADVSKDKISEDVTSSPDLFAAKTPELYLGADRIQYLSSPERVEADTLITFSYPSQLQTDTFAYRGNWQLDGERAMPTTGAELSLRFEAKEVYLVMRPADITKSAMIEVYLDGKLVPKEYAGIDVKDGNVTVDKDMLYKLIKLPASGVHNLKLKFLDNNVELFAFTFG